MQSKSAKSNGKCVQECKIGRDIPPPCLRPRDILSKETTNFHDLLTLNEEENGKGT